MPQLLVTEKLMIAEPAAIPVTIPVLPTVAIDVLLLLQTPVPSLNHVVAPTHTVVVPKILPAYGNGLTVTVAVAKPPDTV